MKGNVTQLRINIQGWTWNKAKIRASITKILDKLVPHKTYKISFYRFRNNHNPERALPATVKVNDEILYHNPDWEMLCSDHVVVVHRNNTIYIRSGSKTLLVIRHGDQRFHYYERTNCEGGKNDGGFEQVFNQNQPNPV